MEKQFYDEKSRQNNFYRKTTYGIYAIPAQSLNEMDENGFVANIKKKVFQRIDKYGNAAEAQPIQKRITTFIDYEKINLEK